MEEDRFLAVNRYCRLHYRIDKHLTAQAAVVLIHGLSSNLTRWTEFLQHTNLKQHWSTLRVDLRGHGESRYRGKLNTHIWTSDLHKIIEKENIKDVVIVGHSLGARIAVEYARQHPEKTLGTILIDPVVPEALQGRGLKLYRMRFIMQVVTAIVRLANKLGLHRRHIPMRDLFELDEQTRRLLATQSHESIAKQYMSPRIDLEFNPLANYLQDMIETLSSLPDVLHSEVPTHILLSAGGSISNVELLEDYFRQGQRVTVEHLQADHWPLTEQPVQTREAIERAIAKLSTKRPGA